MVCVETVGVGNVVGVVMAGGCVLCKLVDAEGILDG